MKIRNRIQVARDIAGRYVCISTCRMAGACNEWGAAADMLLTEATVGLEVPDEVYGAPGESGAEGGEDDFVSGFEFVFVIVETDGDGGA